MARPTKYKEEYIAAVDAYLAQHVDTPYQVVKYKSKTGESYDHKLAVKLPTKEGFALYLGVDSDTINNWATQHNEFFVALRKIHAEQHTRLLNKGLSGEYNSTIAKLILSSNHGYAEKKNIDHTTNGQPITTDLSGEDMQAVEQFHATLKKNREERIKKSAKKDS